MTIVGIRELKGRLSEYLRLVRRGEEVLVTDRSEVVARLSQPSAKEPCLGHEPGLALLAERSAVRVGTTNQPNLYPAFDPLLPPGATVELLAAERAGR